MKTPAFLRRVFGGKFAAKKTQVRRFQAARIDRLSADWIATYSSINEELRGDLDRLRAREAALCHADDIRHECMRHHVGHAVTGGATARDLPEHARTRGAGHENPIVFRLRERLDALDGHRCSGQHEIGRER